MLKFCYTLEWESPPRGNLDFNDEFFENRFFAPIGVYALADKYDIPGMHVCAAQAFPNPGQGIYDIDLYKKIVGAHYEQCVDKSCPMDCKIAALLIEHSRYHHDRKNRQAFITSEEFEKLAKRYPNLSTDLVFQCLKGDGRLFRGPTLFSSYPTWCGRETSRKLNIKHSLLIKSQNGIQTIVSTCQWDLKQFTCLSVDL